MNDERIFINNIFLNMIQIYENYHETRLMIKLFFYIDFEI